MSDLAEQNRIRLLLLDEHGLFRTSLARFLSLEPDFEVAGECATSAEAMEILRGSVVDLVILNFNPGSEHEGQLILAAREAGYQKQFLVVADAAGARAVAAALKLGVSGIFLKSEPPERLVQAIRFVVKGELWVDPKVIQTLANQLVDQCPPIHDHTSSGVLEECERRVLLGILGGLTNRKIGENIGLSESSVKNVVQRLFDKAGVKKRSQLVRIALEGSLGATRNLISQQRAPAALAAEINSKPIKRPLSNSHSPASHR
jgi:two-component system, NarL family, nitrate/nitrite response regulator NarL